MGMSTEVYLLVVGNSSLGVQWSTQNALLQWISDLDLCVRALESLHNRVVHRLVQELLTTTATTSSTCSVKGEHKW